MTHRSRFTLIELIVVIAVVAVLAAMLLPALVQAKKQAMIAICVANMKQNAVGMISYQGDYNGYFPLFGGPPYWDTYGRYTSRVGNPHSWQSAYGFSNRDKASEVYIHEYVGGRFSEEQWKSVPVMFCPLGGYPAFPRPLTFTHPAHTPMTGSISPFNERGMAGFNFLTGRKMHCSTHSNFDTIQRRIDPAEIIITDLVFKTANSDSHDGSGTV